MHIQSNKKEFGQWYANMKWADEAYLKALSQKRAELLSLLYDYGAGFGYNATKTDVRNLSPGCKICAQGDWSCLFINNKCNAACFYCPSSQTEISEPATQSFTFTEAESYIAYLERFGFKGASISGGEPFLTFNKTLSFVSAIKKHFGQKLHLWIYTNGILADESKLNMLADAGLDEIRFDIGATGYSTQSVSLATRCIPVVTVEIPAIEPEKLKVVCKELAKMGVNYLNLHQLRATPYNVERIIKKGFSFIHGPKVLVAESENIALECINYVLKNNIELPVNYCSFVFKNSHQNKAARTRACTELDKPYEATTSSGFLRSLYVLAEQDILHKLHNEFPSNENMAVKHKFYYEKAYEKIFFDLPLLSYFYDLGKDVFLSYSYVAMKGHLSYQNPFMEIRAGNKKIFVEKVTALRPQKIEKSLFLLLKKLPDLASEQLCLQFIGQLVSNEVEHDKANIELLLRVKEFEYMKESLQEYY